MSASEIIVGLVGGYLALGVVVGLVLATLLLERIDPVAKHASPAFRLLILPGLAALWPLMLAKALRRRHA